MRLGDARTQVDVRRQRGLVYVHAVDTHGQRVEQVQAVGVGDRAVQQHVIGSATPAIPTGRQQVHRHASDAILARILHRVAVQVQPDEVADGATGEVTEVRIQVRLPRPQSNGAVRFGDAGAEVDVRRQRGLVHVHAVVADGQRLEEVQTAGTGDVAIQPHVISGAAVAIRTGIQQVHRHISDARFVHILHRVAVQIQPDEVADAATRIVTEVRIQVVLPRAQGDGAVRFGDARAQEDVRRQRGFHHIHAVDAHRQRIEEVCALGEENTSDGRIYHRIGGVAEAIGTSVQKVHPHARDAHLVGVPHTIGIQIHPDEVTDGATGEVPEVRIQVVLSRVQGDGAVRFGDAGAKVDVRRQRGLVHVHAVDANGQRIEEVQAVSIGDGAVQPHLVTRAAEAIGAGVEQVHRHASDARLARILHRVAVQVQPDEVADGAARIVAEVGVQVLLIGIQFWIQGDRAVRILHAGAEEKVGCQRGFVHVYAVAACQQQIEEVVAIGIGGAGIQVHVVNGATETIGTGGVQVQHHARDASLARILHRISIQVQPDEVADLAGGDHGGDLLILSTVGAGIIVADDRRVADLCRVHQIAIHDDREAHAAVGRRAEVAQVPAHLAGHRVVHAAARSAVERRAIGHHVADGHVVRRLVARDLPENGVYQRVVLHDRARIADLVNGQFVIRMHRAGHRVLVVCTAILGDGGGVVYERAVGQARIYQHLEGDAATVCRRDRAQIPGHRTTALGAVGSRLATHKSGQRRHRVGDGGVLGPAVASHRPVQGVGERIACFHRFRRGGLLDVHGDVGGDDVRVVVGVVAGIVTWGGGGDGHRVGDRGIATGEEGIELHRHLHRAAVASSHGPQIEGYHTARLVAGAHGGEATHEAGAVGDGVHDHHIVGKPIADVGVGDVVGEDITRHSVGHAIVLGDRDVRGGQGDFQHVADPGAAFTIKVHAVDEVRRLHLESHPLRPGGHRDLQCGDRPLGVNEAALQACCRRIDGPCARGVRPEGSVGDQLAAVHAHGGGPLLVQQLRRRRTRAAGVPDRVAAAVAVCERLVVHTSKAESGPEGAIKRRRFQEVDLHLRSELDRGIGMPEPVEPFVHVNLSRVEASRVSLIGHHQRGAVAQVLVRQMDALPPSNEEGVGSLAHETAHVGPVEEPIGMARWNGRRAVQQRAHNGRAVDGQLSILTACPPEPGIHHRSRHVHGDGPIAVPHARSRRHHAVAPL